ncbi:hypothetical protein IP88_09115 [alpha proteobacterium AAP81b]|nr:hypothetical protein IP88_09115 [alpha proteobacterium AAP81b]
MPSFASRLFRAVAAALVIIVALLGLFWFLGANQAALSDATRQLGQGDVSLLQPYVDDLWNRLLQTAILSMLVPLVFGLGWVFLVERAPPIGDASAKAKRGSWAIMLLVTWLVVGVLVWASLIYAAIAVTMAPGLGVQCLLAGELAATLLYYLVTALGVFPPSRVSVPGGNALLGGR